MSAYGWVLIIIFIFYLGQFIYGQVIKNNSIVDIFWGLGFIVACWSGYFLKPTFSLNALLVTTLVTLWGGRLSYHIGKRNHGKDEDFRYQNFRKQWGKKWVKTKAFLHVYMLQMFMLILVSSSAVHTILAGQNDWSMFTSIGLCLWLLGFYFEVKSDDELSRFKSDPNNKGKILTTGLYRYSRHPNYFGEATMWWGIYIIGLASGGGLYIISPIAITILVRFVSGVPMLEKHYEHNDAYQAYAKKTSIFFPRRPKSNLP